jgi:hypothetical protein
VNARPTPRFCVCAANRTGTFGALVLGSVATLAGVADGFGAAPRAPAAPAIHIYFVLLLLIYIGISFH